MSFNPISFPPGTGYKATAQRAVADPNRSESEEARLRAKRRNRLMYDPSESFSGHAPHASSPLRGRASPVEGSPRARIRLRKPKEPQPPAQLAPAAVPIESSKNLRKDNSVDFKEGALDIKAFMAGVDKETAAEANSFLRAAAAAKSILKYLDQNKNELEPAHAMPLFSWYQKTKLQKRTSADKSLALNAGHPTSELEPLLNDAFKRLKALTSKKL